MPNARLQSGTVCFIRCPRLQVHNGKVVVVVGFDPEYNGYDCLPQLMDECNLVLVWCRDSLTPLNGSAGLDEMLRITGKPKKTRAPKRKTVQGARHD